MDEEETEEETEEESSDEEMEEEDPEEESTDEDSSDDMSESEPEGETREAPEGEPVEMPVEEPVVTEIDPGVQIPTLHVEEELGQEDRGVQARDIHMIIPPIFEPLSPYYSPLPTEPVESMSPFTESIFAALGEEHIPYDTATSAPLLPPSIPVSPLSLPIPSLPPSPVLPPLPPVDLGELLVPASLLTASSMDNARLTGRNEELRRLVDELIERVARPQGGGSSLPFGLVPGLVRIEADAHAQLRQLASTSDGMVPLRAVVPIVTALMDQVRDLARP